MVGKPAAIGTTRPWERNEPKNVFQVATQPRTATYPILVAQRPRDWIVPAVLACLCCFWPTGICAIYYACKVWLVFIYNSEGITLKCDIIWNLIRGCEDKSWGQTLRILHSNMMLTFSHWTYRKRHRVKRTRFTKPHTRPCQFAKKKIKLFVKHIFGRFKYL